MIYSFSEALRGAFLIQRRAVSGNGGSSKDEAVLAAPILKI